MNLTGEIAAVVLSIGEPTTARAVDSVKRQSLPVRDIVLVEGVTPFHRALNTGAAQVTAPFFVQVDADMILDVECIERLAACLTDGVGLATGFLRDPLYGRVEAIKLFRTACVRRHPFRDSLSPDTDFAAEIAHAGWSTVYALHHHGSEPTAWHTFGDHDPDYTPLYTYAKHIVEGRRLRYRKNAVGLQHRLRQLAKSTHPAALAGTIALAHGVFLDREGDLLHRYSEDAQFRRLMSFLDGAGDDRHGLDLRKRAAPALLPKTTFRRYCELGMTLYRRGDRRRFEESLRRVCEIRHPWSLLAQLGLCHGLFLDASDAKALEADWTTLRAFGTYLEPVAGLRRLAHGLLGRTSRARAAHQR